MRRFHCAALAAVAVTGVVSLASAADLPVKAPIFKTPVTAPSYNWAGFYIGGNVGAGRARFNTSWNADPAFWGALLTPLLNAQGGTNNPTGVVAGGQVGYNFQSGPIVYGLEADFDYTGFSATRDNSFSAIGFPPDIQHEEMSSHWLATVRGRLGVTPTQLSNFMIYGTGGLAIAQVKYFSQENDTLTSITETLDISKVRTGWAVGGGAEYAIDPRWIVRLEYLHVDLGTETDTGVNSLRADGGITRTISYKSDIVRVGLNYMIGK
jgi:outer membrane immunogenic protein